MTMKAPYVVQVCKQARDALESGETHFAAHLLSALISSLESAQAKPSKKAATKQPTKVPKPFVETGAKNG